MALLFKNRGALLLLMFNLFLVFAGIGLVIPVIPQYITILDINGTIAGMLTASFAFTQLIFSPLAGRLSDSLGRKRMIVAGMLVFACAEVIFGLADSALLLFVSRMMGGVSGALIMPTVMAYVADVTSEEDRAKGMGFINASISTGYIIGPGIGGYIAEFGIRVPFYAAGVAGLIAAILTMIVLPESLSSLVKGNGNSDKAMPNLEPKRSLIQQLRFTYREPYFISLIIVFVMSFGLANYEAVYGLFVDHKFGFTPKDIAFIFTFGSIGGALIQLTIFGWIISRYGEKTVITVCLILAGVFVLLTLFVHQYWLIFAVTFVVFLSIDILRPAISTQMSMVAKEHQGYLAGLNSAFTSLGNIIGPVVAGLMFDINVNYPYVVAGIILILCFGLSLRTGIKRVQRVRT
ncbi:MULTISPECIES: MFS transporter [unclassified Paenibacillus]|uniref:MFS transporter n=1 Tax=unclassified Paenibacillus TaxID=185978 RepID=UPI0007BEC81E|nr:MULTISPECIES: MFS transporter [unclassified Paenibacillus]SDK49543.1 MFS transporter, DHA1 family, multidrug resistance protein [Paenibacillus sp. OK060]SEA68827.1 MFS transporter, DHA1 family, multidrug resistance protein [Paenibacillus sp. 276b]